MSHEKVMVGEVADVFRYPVKSMRGERLLQAQIGWDGLAGDRRFAFLDLSNGGRFPWLTARQFAGLLCYVPRFDNPSDLNKSRVLVVTPNGEEMLIESEALLADLSRESGRPLRLMHLNSGIFDAMNLSLISTSSVDEVGRGVGRQLDGRRFRPNVFIRPKEDRPYVEDQWVGDTLVFGDRTDSARMRVNRKDMRCAIVCLDPESAESDPRILKHIVEARTNCLGVYGVTEFPGTVHVGDQVFLIRR